MTDECLGVWARILAAVPKSTLLIRAPVLDDPGVVALTRERWFRAGGQPDMLDLWGRLPHAEMLDAYHEIDVALDPWPFTGATTAAETLDMGVPLVTLRGERYHSRAGAMLVEQAGFYAADTIEHYIDDAVAVAHTVVIPFESARMTRRWVRDKFRRSPACDTRGWARAFGDLIEDVYREVAGG